MKNWRTWWRFHSTVVYAALAVFPEVWLRSPQLEAMLPARVVSTIAPFIGAIGLGLCLRERLAAVATRNEQRPSATVPAPMEKPRCGP